MQLLNSFCIHLLQKCNQSVRNLTVQYKLKFECARLDKVLYKGQQLLAVELIIRSLCRYYTRVLYLSTSGIFIFKCIYKCCVCQHACIVLPWCSEHMKPVSAIRYLLYVCQCKAEDGMPYVVRCWQYKEQNKLTQLTQ